MTAKTTDNAGGTTVVLSLSGCAQGTYLLSIAGANGMKQLSPWPLIEEEIPGR